MKEFIHQTAFISFHKPATVLLWIYQIVHHANMIIQVFSKVHQVFHMIYRIEEVVDTAANTIHDWPNPTLAPDPGL